EGGRLSEAHNLINPCSLAGDKDPWSAKAVVLLRAIGVETVLCEEPAECGLSRGPMRKLVAAFRKLFGKRRKTPGRKLAHLLNRAHDLEVSALRKDHEGVRVLSVEPLHFDQCAVVRRAFLEPPGKTVLVDEMDQPRLLAAVWNEKRCEIGHAR